MKKRNLIWAVLTIVTCASCEDFFEKDLAGKTVTLIAPSNGVTTDISVQTFWWEELDGALEYDLQIVTFSFDSIVQLVVDTTIASAQFQQTLWPSQFQWRVRALNGSSESDFTTYSLLVDTASDLLGQSVLQTSPTDASYGNSLTQNFSWQALAVAEFYRLQVSDDEFGSGANVLDTTLTQNNTDVTFLSEAEYSWRVRGETEFSVSSYSSIWNHTIDTTSPGAVSTLWLPDNNSNFQSQSFDFAWQTITDSGSPLFDSLYVYSDSLVTQFAAYEGNQGSVTDSLGIGTYFWRVRTFDEAGNEGGFSSTRKFTIF